MKNFSILLVAFISNFSFANSTIPFKQKALELFAGSYGEVCSKVKGDDVGLPGSGETITVSTDEVSGGGITVNPLNLNASPMGITVSHLDFMTALGIDGYEIGKKDRRFVVGIGLSVDGETTSATITDELSSPSVSNLCTATNKPSASQKNLWSEFQQFFPKLNANVKCANSTSGKFENYQVVISDKILSIGSNQVIPPALDTESVFISDLDTDMLSYSAMLDNMVFTIGLNHTGNIRIISILKNYSEQISCLFK